MATTNAPVAERGKDSSPRPPLEIWTKDWQPPVPKEVSRAYQRGDTAAGWAAWVAYLAQRNKPADLDKLWPDHLPPLKDSPLLWNLPTAGADSDVESLCRQLYALGGKKGKSGPEAAEAMQAWLAEAIGRAATCDYALECLAWCRALPRLARHAQETAWWELLQHLIGTATEAAGLDLHRQPLEFILLAGELQLTLSHQFPELKTCRRLAAPGRGALGRALVDLLDGQGMPHAANLSRLRPLLACWTRCRLIGDDSPRDHAWSDEAEEQYDWLVTQAMRLARADGSQVFASEASGQWCRPLFDAAVELGGDDADEEIADCILPGRREDYEPEEDWPASSYESDWSELAVLKNKWSKKARCLAVAYDGGRTRIELGSGSQVLLTGAWSLDVSVAGRSQIIGSDDQWEQVAWESDEEVDYLELEMEVAPGCRVQRSFLLAREDQFLLIADAVLADQPVEIAYESRLEVAEGTNICADKESRELTLAGDKRLGRILPLALSEWRTDSRWGTLDCEGQAAVLRQNGTSALFAPLLIDLAPRRCDKPLTWRQLSVGEDRRNVPRDVAVGYRVEIGSAQWLIYRSLAAVVSRTVLGQNLNCEMHVSRFLPTGDVEELLEIEG